MAPRTSKRIGVVPTDRPSGIRLRDQVAVVCELACDDPTAILSLAEELGCIAADLWIAGKLGDLPPNEDIPDADDED